LYFFGAEDWVSERLLRILEGKSSSVASGMRGCATRLKLTPEQRASKELIFQSAHNDSTTKVDRLLRLGEVEGFQKLASDQNSLPQK
jgi:hypothetical protein